MPAAARTDTAERILDLAERLVQTRGYNGFSYADIAVELQVTKASLHYHFAAKADLGRRLIERYADSFASALASIDARDENAGQKLRRYMAIYADVLRDGRMCLCGMLAADQATIPAPMQTGLRRFFELNEAWLETILTNGAAAGDLRFVGSSLDQARLLVSSLEGAMLIARSFGDVARFDSAARRMLDDLTTPRGRTALA